MKLGRGKRDRRPLGEEPGRDVLSRVGLIQYDGLVAAAAFWTARAGGTGRGRLRNLRRVGTSGNQLLQRGGFLRRSRRRSRRDTRNSGNTGFRKRSGTRRRKNLGPQIIGIQRAPGILSQIEQTAVLESDLNEPVSAGGEHFLEEHLVANLRNAHDAIYADDLDVTYYKLDGTDDFPGGAGGNCSRRRGYSLLCNTLREHRTRCAALCIRI